MPGNGRARASSCSHNAASAAVRCGEDWAAMVTRNSPRETWTSQCDAALGILDDFGTDKALGYLVGEKFLNFLEVAEHDPDWRAEIPGFVAQIKDIFEPWQLAEYLDTPRRLGALGHTSDEEGHRLLRSQMEEEDLAREDARNLTMLEWVKELLVSETE